MATPLHVATQRDRIYADLKGGIEQIPLGDPQFDLKASNVYAFHFGRLLALLDLCVDEGVAQP